MTDSEGRLLTHMEPQEVGTGYPDGVWLVINEGGERYEVPISLPKLGWDEVADMLRAMDGKALWQEAISGADAMTDPVDRMLELIAQRFD